MKPIHYSLVFVFGVIGGWGIYQLENSKSSVVYDQPSVCEVLDKNHPECK
jgi:hypothetical protein